MLVLVMKVDMLNVLLSVLFHALAPIKIARPLMVEHKVFDITTIVDNSNRIPFGLNAIRHESLELMQRYAIPSHNMVEILLEDDLSILVLGLEITVWNGHDTLICGVIYMTNHGSPINNTFNMIGHHLSILKIFTRLHVPN